jgi:hypothetical protein
MMMQLFWVQSSPDLTEWDWDAPQARSLLRYLEFTRESGVTVILTDWGWSAKPDYHRRLYESPTDPRYARGIAAYLDELILRRGFTNIKYLIVGNEPDLELARVHSMDEYVALYRNVDQALREAGLRDRIKLTGPDMGGQWAFMESAIDQLKDVLDVYDLHRYASTDEVRHDNLAGPWETLWTRLDRWRTEVNRRDEAGAAKPILLTEMGMDRGGVSSHSRIDSFEYGLDLADYGTTLLTTRLNAGIAWTLHDVDYFDGEQFMEWGMWKEASSGSVLRPWGQAFGLLIRHAPPGSLQAPIDQSPPEHPEIGPYRVAAVTRPGGGWSIFVVNQADQPACLRLTLPASPTHPLDVYRYERHTPAAFPDDLALPPIGSLRATESLLLAAPARSFTVLVEQPGPPAANEQVPLQAADRC